MTTLTTGLGMHIEDAESPPDLPSDPRQLFHEIARRITENDFRCRRVGIDPQGCRIFLIGEGNWSRAIAIHPKDKPGILHLLVDTGDEMDFKLPVRAERAVWFHELIAGSYPGIKKALEPDRHRNDRLVFAYAF